VRWLVFAADRAPVECGQDLKAWASLALLVRQFDNYQTTVRTVAHCGARCKTPEL
jgi:adenosine deaminase